jgi:hypothetical protein
MTIAHAPLPFMHSAMARGKYFPRPLFLKRKTAVDPLTQYYFRVHLFHDVSVIGKPDIVN